MFDGNYLKLNTAGYGGMINYSWLDRPLSIAGRVITSTNGIYEKQLINIDKDLMIIPSQAIHINRDVNSKNELNHQVDMLPIISLTNEKKLEDIIRENLEESQINVDKICDYDLYLYNRDKAKYIGLNDDFILSPRLDDLASLYPALEAFINSTNTDSLNVLCAFNNEEIGSMTHQGADSSFLIDTLSRISTAANINLLVALNNSMVVSADNAHALHPNAQSKSDPTNKVLLNKGVVIKHHTNYTTDAVTSSLFKGICERAEVPYQDFSCRSDMRCGATLGGISQSHVAVDSVDIGLPQLAMHSANETIGSKDVLHMYKALLEFYNSTIIKERSGIKILRKEK
jgi:aspartyl aminopeptidase